MKLLDKLLSTYADEVHTSTIQTLRHQLRDAEARYSRLYQESQSERMRTGDLDYRLATANKNLQKMTEANLALTKRLVSLSTLVGRSNSNAE